MAAKPKLTPDEWADVRAAWEDDPREGYAWLVDELALPVSAPGVRKTALKEGWVKVKPPVSIAPKGMVSGKVSKVSKVSQDAKKNHGKVSQAIKETMPETLGGVNSQGGDTAVEQSGFEIGAGLTAKEERFVSEYLVDLNATQAYMRVYPGSTESAARTSALRMLTKATISAAIEKAKSERAARTGINADRALAEVWAVATADPRDLVHVKVGCCRNCYGEGHQRQRTVGEMNRDREKHVTKGKEIAEFDEEGGIGFNALMLPSPECPACGGDGQARVVLADTRHLSPQAAALYAGAKQGKHGIEVQFHSKAEALDKVFKHLGLYEKEVEVNLNVFPPREVLDAIYAKALAEAAVRDAFLVGRRERLGIVIENGGSND